MTTWTKTVDEDVEVTNENLTGSIFIADERSPDAGKVIVRMTVTTDLGSQALSAPLDATSLSAAEQTAFKQAWLTIRDDLLTANGYVPQ